MQIDISRKIALTEMFSVAIGRAESVLDELVDARVKLSVSPLRRGTRGQLIDLLRGLGERRLATVTMRFTGSSSGSAGLVFAATEALKLVSALVGDGSDADELDAIHIGGLTEIGNIVLNAVMSSMSNALDQHLHCSVPEFLDGSIDRLFCRDEAQCDDGVIVAKAQLEVGDCRVTGEIVLVFESSTVGDPVAEPDQRTAVL